MFVFSLKFYLKCLVIISNFGQKSMITIYILGEFQFEIIYKLVINHSIISLLISINFVYYHLSCSRLANQNFALVLSKYVSYNCIVNT